MSDQLILEELRKGNTKVFSLIYNFYPLIENYILSNNGSKEEAKDIFQESLVVFYQKVKTPNFEMTSKISTYVFGVCKNKWLKTLRKKKKTTELNEDTYQLAEEEKREINEDEIISYVQEKLNILGDPCKSLIIFHEFHRLKWAVIAEKMNYATAHTARNQKYKCLVRLKKLIPEQLKNALIG